MSAFIKQFYELKVKELEESSDKEDEIYPQFMKNLSLLHERIKKIPYTEFGLLEVMNILNTALSKYYFIRLGFRNECPIGWTLEAMKDWLLDMDRMSQSQILFLSNIKKDMDRLL